MTWRLSHHIADYSLSLYETVASGRGAGDEYEAEIAEAEATIRRDEAQRRRSPPTVPASASDTADAVMDAASAADAADAAVATDATRAMAL